MEKPQFPYTMDHKRYHTLNYYNLHRHGGKVQKASIDAGFTCPNRDGRKAVGGCIYCDSGSRYFSGEGTVAEQLQAERQRIRRKQPEAKLIAYFQAGTNTYAPVSTLKEYWSLALEQPDVVGISVATRADCLGEAVLDALSEINEKTALTVELGLQTVHDKTAEFIHRGHSFEAFLTGYEALKRRAIRTCVHLINGLPGETQKMMLETAGTVGKLSPGGVKIHLMHVTRGTFLAELWAQGKYIPMEKNAYVAVTAEQLRYFPPETVIERLTGDGDKEKLLAPLWSRDKISVLGAIDKYMAEKQIVQGDLFED